METKKKDNIIKEATKLCFDLAKLVFAGIILVGIMQTGIGLSWLLGAGVFSVTGLLLFGFLLTTYKND